MRRRAPVHHDESDLPRRKAHQRRCRDAHRALRIVRRSGVVGDRTVAEQDGSAADCSDHIRERACALERADPHAAVARDRERRPRTARVHDLAAANHDAERRAACTDRVVIPVDSRHGARSQRHRRHRLELTAQRVVRKHRVEANRRVRGIRDDDRDAQRPRGGEDSIAGTLDAGRDRFAQELACDDPRKRRRRSQMRRQDRGLRRAAEDCARRKGGARAGDRPSNRAGSAVRAPHPCTPPLRCLPLLSAATRRSRSEFFRRSKQFAAGQRLLRQWTTLLGSQPWQAPQRGGDARAHEALVRVLWPNAYRIAWSILGEHGAAEDAAQAACAAICAKLSTLSDTRAFVGWAYRIIVSHARDHARARSRRQMRESLDYDEATVGPAHDDPTVRLDLEAAIGRAPGTAPAPARIALLRRLDER